jgi:hypothetical protein
LGITASRVVVVVAVVVVSLEIFSLFFLSHHFSVSFLFFHFSFILSGLLTFVVVQQQQEKQ